MDRDPFNESSNNIVAHSVLPAGVWRASEQAIAAVRTCSSTHSELDTWLPGGGWPRGSLIEILTDAPGSGEIALIAPSLAALPTQRPIVLLKPPAVPNVLAWQQWQISSHRLWWLHPKTLPDAWWSAETVLRGHGFAALMAWLDPIDEKALRRLHACVQETDTLMFLFRPKRAAQQFSPSPLRLMLTPSTARTMSIEIIKCKGSKPGVPIVLTFKPDEKTAAGVGNVDGHRTVCLVP
ncbi:translesion DNA synthesis-associated protein ImuA [Orrella daihaiensis]|uniref:Translesion DNA synthesis-associated protein ImuA n=1 Tax=Orrella daihaiensis TaxID=2782176 RepID=A0ABY4AK02_9BURK|nr:translesion DNA synthesis-associated protein ImuA [Orrella daihaiensis]UOD49387.1 translesion DNA synthesis-associated protein ImuA [Orrella daihaiensis]